MIFGNHSSWWDPLVAIHLAERFFDGFQHFSPIDADALEKYKIFKRFGFYGVDQSSRRGAIEFLKTSRQILSTDKTCIWITPEGKFVDVRNHDEPLEPGIAHLASRSANTLFLPLAVELCFWEEKQPELFCRFGKPIRSDSEATKDHWNQELASSLRQTQTELAEQVISRDESHFEVLISSRGGVNWIYDSMRWLASAFRGSTVESSHGKKLENLRHKRNAVETQEVISDVTSSETSN